MRLKMKVKVAVVAMVMAFLLLPGVSRALTNNPKILSGGRS